MVPQPVRSLWCLGYLRCLLPLRPLHLHLHLPLVAVWVVVGLMGLLVGWALVGLLMVVVVLVALVHPLALWLVLGLLLLLLEVLLLLLLRPTPACTRAATSCDAHSAATLAGTSTCGTWSGMCCCTRTWPLTPSTTVPCATSGPSPRPR